MDWKTKLTDYFEPLKNVYHNVKAKLVAVYERCRPTLKKIGKVFGDAGYVIGLVGRWMFKLRSLFLSIPVAFAAIALALENLKRLPEEVGLFMQTNGEYAYVVSRATAVNAPLIITGVCLLLMCCSRRVVYPWLISIFSLALPVLLMLSTLLEG